MVLALAIALLSVALGVALGLGRNVARRALGPVRTFALVAAVATVALELVPGAGERGGAPALAVFVVALAAPWLLEQVGGLWGAGRSPAARLEAGYAALLVHHVGDGLGLGVYSGGGHDGHVHWDVLLSIGGHTVPVTAVVVLAFARRASRRAAALRGFGFAAAIAVGIALADVGSAAAFERVEPYLTAAVAGLLLHVAAHDWLEDPPKEAGARLFDLIAAAAGLALVTASIGAHDHHGGAADHGGVSVGAGAIAMALRFSPPLLAAAVLGALLARSVPSLVPPSSGFLGALRAAVLGATTGDGARRDVPATVPGEASSLAFSLGRAGLGLATLALAANAFGPGFAGAWIGLAAVLIALLAWSSGRMAARDPKGDLGPSAGAGGHPSRPPPAASRERLLDGVERAFATSAAPAGLGVVVAAGLAVLLRDGALAPLSLRRIDLVLLPLVALALRVPAVALVAPLLVLVDKGANAPAALAALAAAAATPRGVLAGRRVSIVAIGAVALVAIAVALLGSTVSWPPSPIRTRPSSETHPVDILAAVLLGALAVAGAWRRGVRAWMAVGLGRGEHHHGICFEASAGEGHEQAHAHAHAHAAPPVAAPEPSSDGAAR